MKFARAIGWFNTRVLLTLTYFIILAIPALIMKLVNYSRWKDQQNIASFWEKKEPTVSSIENASRQF